MLIDFSLVPPGIASQSQVNKLNACFDRLSARLVDQIVIPEPGSTFRASNLIRVYLQSHLRRVLQLIESGFTEFFNQRGIVTMICARGLYESLATVRDFEKELTSLIAAGDIQRVFDFTKERAHATKIKKWIANLDNPALTAKNVLTMVAKLTDIRAEIQEEYDFLSEIAHPNSVGAVGFFAKMNNNEDVAYFSDSGPDPQADLQWMFVASYLLSNFEEMMNRIEAQLPGLSALGTTQRPI